MEDDSFSGALMGERKNIDISLLDRKILYLLSLNARFSNTSIAAAIGVSKEKINYRIARMEKLRFIEGYMTVFNLQRFNLLNFIVLIKLKNLVSKKEILKSMNSINEVTQVQHIGGRWDLLVLFSINDLKEYDDIYNKIMCISENIQEFRILQQVDEDYTGLGFLLDKETRNKIHLKHKNPFSFSNEFIKQDINGIYSLDETDFKIISKLKLNARITLNDISIACGLTLQGTKYRLSNLVKLGFIRHFVPMFSISDLGMQWNLAFLSTKNIQKPRFHSFLRQHPNITWYEQYIGDWNFMISLFTKDNFSFNKVLEDLKGTFGEEIINFETVTVFEQLKFSPNL